MLYFSLHDHYRKTLHWEKCLWKTCWIFDSCPICWHGCGLWIGVRVCAYTIRTQPLIFLPEWLLRRIKEMEGIRRGNHGCACASSPQQLHLNYIWGAYLGGQRIQNKSITICLICKLLQVDQLLEEALRRLNVLPWGPIQVLRKSSR